MDNEWQENKFVNDTIRQLKSGMLCYVYTQEQVDEIKELYEQETGLQLKIEQIEYYFILKPTKALISTRF